MIKRFTEMEKDFLRDLANIGAGNASTLLSQFIGIEVHTSLSTFDRI